VERRRSEVFGMESTLLGWHGVEVLTVAWSPSSSVLSQGTFLNTTSLSPGTFLNTIQNSSSDCSDLIWNNAPQFTNNSRRRRRFWRSPTTIPGYW
jgi:hypothetical protein